MSPRLMWVLVACCCLWGVQGASAAVTSTGDITIPCPGNCPAAQTNPTSAQAMPAGCAESATADIPARWQLPQYPSSWRATSNSEKKRGPHLNLYQPVLASQVPSNCNPTSWAWKRLLQVVTDTIDQQINYCHHHAPAYQTPASVQQHCTITEPGEEPDSCVCSAAGMRKAHSWRGVDCSNFAAFAHNLAFGFYPTSDIGQIACHPTKAPGRLLTSVTTSKLDQLSPGDLVFITVSSKGRSPPARVSHVVFWTGWTVDFLGGGGRTSKAALMANVADKEKGSVEKCMAERQAAGLPVYVIADSHHNGPELRPFCGWYINSFSHARRMINPDTSLPVNDASVAFWDGTTCQSNWALRG